jgi:hypothetical protein
MRHVGARHPHVIFAPDHFAGWSGAKDKAAMTTALECLAQLPNAYVRISSTSLGPYADLTPPTSSGRCCKGQPGGSCPPAGGSAMDLALRRAAAKGQNGGGREGHH